MLSQKSTLRVVARERMKLESSRLYFSVSFSPQCSPQRTSVKRALTWEGRRRRKAKGSKGAE